MVGDVASPATTIDEVEPLREYSLGIAISGFGIVGITWIGTSREDARDGFLEWLHNDDQFADGLRYPHYRSLYVRFNGRHMLLTFRTDWVAGFTAR